MERLNTSSSQRGILDPPSKTQEDTGEENPIIHYTYRGWSGGTELSSFRRGPFVPGITMIDKTDTKIASDKLFSKKIKTALSTT